MQVGTLAVQHIFEKDVLYRVPLYQRPYVWDEAEQWQPLWEDVHRLADLLLAGGTPRAHFLGATVQDKVIVPPGQIETRLLIDGQQRLTTLQLLLKAFHDVAAARGHDRYASAIAKLFRNDHPLATEPFEQFKIYPTNADRDDFRAVLLATTPGELAKAHGGRADARAVGRPITDGYLFFARAITGWLCEAEPAETRIAALYGAVRDNVRLVVIDLDEKDDAQLIFETLNARGTPLLAADLVKNALLSRIERDHGQAEHAYQAYWQAFDADSTFWRAPIGRGHARRARIELFLQFALTIMGGQDIAAGHLYAAYRDFAARADAPSAIDQMKRLHRYGGIYRRLIEGQEPPRIRLFLDRLAVMEFDTVYPFLIKLFDRMEDDRDLLIPVLVDVESFLVRRLVTRLSTRGYNRLFVDLLAALEGPASGIGAAVRTALAAGTAEVDRWPDDAAFAQAWSDNALYENLTRPRLRMLLEAVEMGLRNDFAETQAVPRGLTVEHVLPQSWHSHWPLSPGEDAAALAATRERLVHTIGNLTLLNAKLNPSQSNYGWVGDLDVPGKRDGLRDNSTLFLNKMLAAQESWGEDAIRERAGALFGVARQTWPRLQD